MKLSTIHFFLFFFYDMIERSTTALNRPDSYHSSDSATARMPYASESAIVWGKLPAYARRDIRTIRRPSTFSLVRC